MQKRMKKENVLTVKILNMLKQIHRNDFLPFFTFEINLDEVKSV